jgi:5-methylcytosine-specific restriction endonuclease McrA
MRHDRGTYYKQCRDCMASRKWAAKNPERHKEYCRQWWNADKSRSRKIYNDFARIRRQNPLYLLENRVRCGLYRNIRGQKKQASTFDLLGYTKDDLIAHLERQFVKGMSWENIGEWHVDHIVPLSSFHISGPDDPELRRAWALANLRPLWATENLRKKDKRTHLI